VGGNEVRVLDKEKILGFMTARKAVLDEHIIRDFSGSIWDRLSEQREVKYWKEAIERGEFDTEIQEVYVILSKTQPEIVDFTFYTDKRYQKILENLVPETFRPRETGGIWKKLVDFGCTKKYQKIKKIWYR
jgi:hypothetical protein